MKTKWFLSMVLSLLLSSVVAHASEPLVTEGQIQNSGFYDYIVLEDNTVEIVFYRGDENQLSIPSEIDNHPVSSIGTKAFSRCSFLNSVIIPAPVKNIGTYAFAECGLTSVVLPDTLLSIGDGAFWNCIGLDNIILSDSLVSIGDESFSWCASLDSITIPESVVFIGTNPFSYCTKLSEINVAPNSNFAVVDGALFEKENSRLICYPCANKNLSYSIPNGTQYIDNKAFVSCRLLKEVTIPDTVTGIGDSAFYDCESLLHLDLPDSIVSVGDDAFSWCTSLANITLSNSLTDIGNYAFYNCKSLQSISLPNSVRNIGDGAFSWCGSLKSVTIPDSIIEIGSNPFSYCATLTEISVSSDSNFAVISGVLFEKNNKRLICYPYAYSDSTYVIPEGIMTIGEEAFSGCQLSTIVLPESMASIEDNAFSYCNSLDDLNIPFSVANIADNAFVECNTLTLIVNQSSYAEEYAISRGIDYILSDANGQRAEEQSASKDEPQIFASGEYEYTLLEDGGACITKYAGDAETLTIPGTLDGHTVRKIGDSAFANHSSLTSVTFPNTLTSLGNMAFSSTGLKDITLPEGIVSIGDFTFSYCHSLTSVVIPNSLSSVGVNPFLYCPYINAFSISPDHSTFMTVDGMLFDRATKTIISCPPASAIGEFVVPDGTAAIGETAFAYCSGITSIVMPEGLTYIGKQAFSGCAFLTDIVFPDSLVSIDSAAFEDCRALKSISFGSGLTSVGSFAFCNCKELTTVTLPDSLSDCASSAFLRCESLTDIVVSPNNPYLEINDHALYDKTAKALLLYPMASTDVEVIVPAGITTICDHAFAFCDIVSISLPDSITTIGEYAFQSCSQLVSINLPDGLSSIGTRAFSWCEKLPALTLSSNISYIGEDAFEYCDDLTLTVERDSYAAQYASDNRDRFVLKE